MMIQEVGVDVAGKFSIQKWAGTPKCGERKSGILRHECAAKSPNLLNIPLLPLRENPLRVHEGTGG